MNQSRILEKKIEEHFQNYNQALVLLGARQVGKTTLLRRIFPNALYLLLDEQRIKQTLETYNSDTYRVLIGEAKQIIIDELHLLSDPGRAVKLIYDQIKGVQIIVTGSSSLHVKNKTAESMAGRAIDYYLFPLTYWEYLYQQGIESKDPCFVSSKIINQDNSDSIKLYDVREMLNNIMIYGQYPEILNMQKNADYLKNLVDKAVFKDIIELDLIDNRAKALELLKVLAYQIGNIISYSEIANKLHISTPTVQRYIEIFEQSFLIYRIYPFSKNARDEIGKAPKIYFWDLGLRNALIENFDSMNIRSDAGAMFENFIINEVKKDIIYLDLNYKVYYWRLKSGSEVDLVLQNNKEIIGCEIKLTGGGVSQAFKNRYGEAKVQLVTAKNFI